MSTLDMLMAREELLNQIEYTIDGELSFMPPSERYELIRELCDKVCEAFPAPREEV